MNNTYALCKINSLYNVIETNGTNSAYYNDGNDFWAYVNGVFRRCPTVEYYHELVTKCGAQ